MFTVLDLIVIVPLLAFMVEVRNNFKLNKLLNCLSRHSSRRVKRETPFNGIERRAESKELVLV